MNSCSAVFPPYACRVPLIDLHGPSFAVSIVPKAAPAPLLGLADQSTLYWIAMYVAQLLHGGPHIEMKVCFVPKRLRPPALKYPQLETTVAVDRGCVCGQASSQGRDAVNAWPINHRLDQWVPSYHRDQK